LQDSPALNAHSRAVLVPLTRTELPRVINVPGPGPTETRSSDPAPPVPVPPVPVTLASKPAPPLPPDADSEVQDDEEDRNDDNGDEDEHVGSRRAAADPYSNLDGAFGNYLQADDPKPLHHGRNVDEDDPLF
jgi:AP-2 complex subunit beta-1